MHKQNNPNALPNPSRRNVITSAVGGATLAALGGSLASAQEGPAETTSKKSSGKINQSIVFWCFNAAGEKWNIAKTCQVANKLGCKSVELVNPQDWPTLKKHNLVCAISNNGMPGAPFMKGFNNTRYHEEVIQRTKNSIDETAAAGFPNVIAFTGFKWRDADDPKSGEI
jgi:hydroxypyruvate isomerase